MSPLSLSTFTLRKTLWAVAVALLVVFIVTYTGYQSRSFINGPSIVLTSSIEPIQHEKMITVTGTTQNIVELIANGKEIYTDEYGNFSHQLILEDGYTVTTFSAKDRFGRKTSIERSFVYVPLPEDAL